MTTLTEERQLLADKRQTKANYESETLDARVVANYGDPGLDENYHFDILSRYLVCMIESCQRVVTKDRYPAMIVLVKRPRQLWIDVVGEKSTLPVNQSRKDYNENISKGLAGSFSSAGISRIYPAYSFGETIKIKKLTMQSQAKLGNENSEIFSFASAFPDWNASTWGYGAWHSEGQNLPYFKNQNMKDALRLKTIEPTDPTNSRHLYYRGVLHKYQYEAFMLTQTMGNTNLNNGLVTLFNGSFNGNQAVYSANGGYIFANNTDKLYLDYVGYEDTNLIGRSRLAANACIPMVISAPNTWPVPQQRTLSTILYNPSYSPITR